MNKKECNEIKKLFTPANCAISRICGCYVDSEKNKKTELKEAFLSLPEEEAFKYFTIFNKTLSGTVGRNLVNLDFPLEEEHEGGHQEFLLKLRNSKLKDDALVEEFYNRIIDTFPFGENYYIILIHVAYDVPGKATDGTEMYDASDNVFEYLLCSLCPVHLSKPGLGYNEAKNCIENRIQDWIVDQPMKGFLFPAFNDRYTDIHSMLYYTKNATDLQEDFLKNMFGCTRIPLDADSQKETFNCLIADTLGTDCDYSVVKNIHENLTEMIEEHKEIPEPLTLDKHQVKSLFEKSGVKEEKLTDFDKLYDAAAGEDTSLFVNNVANVRTFEVKTPDVVVKVNPERADLVNTLQIDGKRCLVIEINDHVEVNGITIHQGVSLEDVADEEE